MPHRPGSAARLRALGFAAVLLVGLAACSGADGTSSQDSGAAEQAPEGAAVDQDSAVEPAAGEPDVSGGGDDAAIGQGGEALPPAPPARPGDRVIKEGTVRVEVAAGGFDQAFQQVVAEARRLGGDVVASTTSAEGDDGTFGSLTVRVPVSAFEDLLVGVARIGEVQGRDIRAQDVSVEFVDLESRLRHLQAQERFYLGLLEDAQTVGDAIAVQQQLDGVQGQVEQVRGRLSMLEERTSYSRLTVELAEPGASGTALQPLNERRDLLRWWEAGLDAFVTMLGALMVAVLFALPLLVVAVPAMVALRALRRRRGPRPADVVPGGSEREPERVDV